MLYSFLKTFVSFSSRSGVAGGGEQLVLLKPVPGQANVRVARLFLMPSEQSATRFSLLLISNSQSDLDNK